MNKVGNNGLDLLGRTTAYTDTWGDWTGYEYDAVGNLTRKYGDMGEEVFYYDNYNRLTSDVFDGTTYAAVTYDSYGRTNYIDYSNAGSTRLTYGRDALGRTTTLTYRMGDGTTTVADAVTPTQSNRVSAEAVTSGSTTLNSSFGYDAAGRLTSASVGSNSYSYGFGTANSSCNSLTGNNTNAGKSSNRTTQTINGTTTTFCYDQADRLIGSSNSLYSTPTYDSRGNMLTLGTGSTPLNMGYDSSNRNSYLTQLTSAGTGTGMYYNSDALDRITYREKDTITTWNWALSGQWFYAYTGSGNSSSFIRDANWNIVEKTIQLPGGVLLTVKPQLTGNNQKQYSMPSALGRTLLTANAAGTNISTGPGPLSSYAYDPYGNPSTGVLPANTTEGSYGFGGSLEKVTETNFALTPIQMGARVYISSLGRFTSVDPIPGGTPNSYVYVTDPINMSDYSGLAYSCQLQCTVTVSYLQPAAQATQITATARITSTGMLAVKVKIALPPASGGAPAPKLPVASDAKLQVAANKDTTVRMLTSGSLNSSAYQSQMMPGDSLRLSGRVDHALTIGGDYAEVGEIGGRGVGCVVGGTALGVATKSLYGAAVGCGTVQETGAIAGYLLLGGAGIAIGFVSY